MLWRTHYEPRVLRNLPIPPLSLSELDQSIYTGQTPKVILGAFSVTAQAELGVWRRLFQEAFPKADWLKTVFFLENHSSKALRDIAAVTPRSQRDETLLATPGAEWRALIQPDKDERSFLVVIQQETSPLAVVGPPTEEVWDLVRETVTPN